MRWYRHLYIGKTASENKSAIIRALRKGKPQLGTYVITRAMDSDGILDIYHNAVLLSGYYKDRDPLIMGIATGKREAMEVARNIVNDMYLKNGDFDIDTFGNSEHS